VSREPTNGSGPPVDEGHWLDVEQLDCGCVRLSCEHGHTPEQILGPLGLAPDDLLCPEHREQA